MAEIRRCLWMRHLRAEATSHVLHFRKGALLQAGRGLAFWFYPMAAAIAEVPVDNRDLNYLFKGRTLDYQEVNVQGVITYRVVDAARLAERVDFSIDLKKGTHQKQPLDQLAVLLTGVAQQAGLQVIALAKLGDFMVRGCVELAQTLTLAFRSNPILDAMGIAVETVRVDEVKPSAELERALQIPTRESIQQRADEATFLRRALAVEKERAIAENELAAKVELTRRQEALILQEGRNARQKIDQDVEARRLGVVSQIEDERLVARALADRQTLDAETTAAQRRIVAAVNAEEQRLLAEIDAEQQRLRGAAEADRQRQLAAGKADADRLLGAASAERARLEGAAQAETLQAIGEAKAVGEQKRLDAYRELPQMAVLALAVQELAAQLKIEHLTVTPDMLGALLEKVANFSRTKAA